MRLNDINGHYDPSFFNIVLDTDKNALQAREEYPSTFAHEFIHYLQDLILPYNIRMNLSNLLWFINVREVAIDKGHIKRPFNDWNNDSKTTKLQYDYTFGISNSVKEVWDIDNAKTISLKASGFDSGLSKQYREFDVYKYNLPINKYKSYHLGAHDILEYIAYKIEVKHYGKMDFDQLPYKSIDLLFQQYGLSYVSDDIRLCISEFCLYNDNPVHLLFLHFLENEEFKQSIKNLTFEEIYQRLLNSEFVAKDNIRETITNKTNRRLKQFAEVLPDVYDCFTEIKNWILKANKFAANDLSERFIFSDMYKMDKGEFEGFIDDVINKIGLPLMMNKKEEYVTLTSEDIDTSQFEQFYILQRFLNFVSSKSKNSCPIYNFCKANYSMYNDSCNKNLQSKMPDSKDCPYINFLKSYGLSNVEIS